MHLTHTCLPTARHPSDIFAQITFNSMIMRDEDFDSVVKTIDEHSIGARSRFYRLVDEFTRP